MRSLTNPLYNKDGKKYWRMCQQSQISRLGIAGLQVAFPGSLLCNHVLVPVGSDRIDCQNHFSVPDISAVVYEYCSSTERSSLLKGSLLVDIDGDSASDSIASVIVEHAIKMQVKRVVLLGDSAYRLYADLIRQQLSIEVSVYEPDWTSPAALHSVYRQASFVLFVNTMRILDAACTGCRCSLIAGGEMQEHQTFGVLQGFLHSTACGIYAENGQSISAKEPEFLQSHVVVENSHSAVQKILKRCKNAEEDRLIELNLEDSAPVITLSHSPAGKYMKSLRDKKTGIHRKFAKLYDDPKSFFADSKFRILRAIGQLYP